MNDTGPLEENFTAVYVAASKVIETRGERQHHEDVRLTYVDGPLEVARTGADEYEVRHKGVLVFRCRAGGGRSSAHVFEPGEWMVQLAQQVEGGLRQADK